MLASLCNERPIGKACDAHCGKPPTHCGGKRLKMFGQRYGTVSALSAREFARQKNRAREGIMLHYALVFLVVALIAGLLGVSGVAAMATNIAYVLFVIAIVLFLVHLLSGRRTIA